MRMLMLATDAYGGLGGIAQYNRDILDALNGLERLNEIVVLPRAAADQCIKVPAKVRYDLESAGGTRAYIQRCLAHAFGRAPIDVVYCAHINLLPLAAMIAWAKRAPLALMIYGIDGWSPPSQWLRRRAAQLPDLVLSISQITLDRFHEWCGAEAPSAILPNAIDLGNFAVGTRSPDLEARYGITGCKVIMTFGRMSRDERYKGFDEIIELMPRLRLTHPNLIYLAAGDGTDRARLEAKAGELGVGDAVVFTGRVSEDEKADHYRLADAYVMPSSGEGFGFVVLEALACGIPVVVSATDGTREAVRAGLLGQVVDPADTDELESAVLKALDQPKSIPVGLDYFTPPSFTQRLREALSKIVQL